MREPPPQRKSRTHVRTYIWTDRMERLDIQTDQVSGVRNKCLKYLKRKLLYCLYCQYSISFQDLFDAKLMADAGKKLAFRRVIMLVYYLCSTVVSTPVRR